LQNCLIWCSHQIAIDLRRDHQVMTYEGKSHVPMS
jgi:hypothetical protein